MTRQLFYPLIDYVSHPAFRSLDYVPFARDAAVYELASRLDENARAIVEDGQSAPEAPGKAFESKISPLMADLRQLVLDGVASAQARRWLDLAFLDALKEMLDELLMCCQARSYQRADDGGEPVHSALEKDGMYAFHVGEATRRRILGSVDREVRALRARRHETDRIVANISRYSDTGLLLDRAFREHRVYEGLATYKGGPIAFTGFALEYSHPAQKWWKGCYADVGLPDSKTAYMHYDHGCRYPKAIFALTDVGPENGPTHFVRRSTHAPRSRFIHTMVKSIDKAFFEAFDESYLNKYHRRRFAEPRYRRIFMEFPKAFQSCSQFGEDILDGSELSDHLLANEARLTSDVGHCIVFDGDYGIHRGGNVREGERLVFQIIFKVETPPSALRQRYSHARWLARSWVDRIKHAANRR